MPVSDHLRPIAMLLGLAGAACALAACASERTVARFSQVERGMAKDEVVALLGAPSSRWPLTEARDGLDGERLQWGDGLSSLASSAVFAGDPDRAYSVVFDAGGRVVSTAEPRWTEPASESDEAERLRDRRAVRGEQ